MPAHYDLVGGQRDQRSARHRVMWYEHGDLPFVAADSTGDLQRREDETSRCVQNEVQGDVVVGHMDRAEDLFRVVYVDIAHDRKSEEPHRLLTMHEQDDAGVTLPLQLGDLPHPHGIQHALPQDRLKRRQHKEDPENIEH